MFEKKTYKIKLDKSVTPVIYPTRKSSIALRSRLKETLDEMEKRAS
jgi:hypothetical protein